jgi:hypothetical protein
MATQLILANAAKLARVNLTEIIGLPLPHYGRTDMCFFLERELSLTKEQAIRVGAYRHLKVYKEHFLDYIAKKEYATLEDWVTDCGSSMDKVMFGFSRFDGYRTYITLKQLINYLVPSPPQDREMDELAKFAQKLFIDELNLKNNVMVRTPRVGILTYTQYMDG